MQQDIAPTDAGDTSLTKIEANFTELYGDVATAKGDITDLEAVVNNASASAPASIDLAEDTDNGTNKITLTAPSAIASDKVITLPDATDTLVGKDTTDTLTNKTLTNPVVNFTDTAPSINVKCRAYLGTDQLNLTDLAYTKVNLDTENYDVGSDFDTTNKRFIAPVSGYYQVNSGIYFYGITVDKRVQTHIYVNGASYASGMVTNGSLPGIICNVSDIVYCTAGQYIELYARAITGDNTTDLVAGANSTFMSVHLLSI